MSIYRVTLKARGLRATINGPEVSCGFFKNEFVWARSSEQAVAKARANVESALRRNASVNQDDLSTLRIDIDEVEPGLGISNLLQRQGFIFHRLDTDEDSGDDG